MGQSKHTLEYTLPVFPSQRRKLVEELTQQEIIMKLFGPKNQDEADDEYQAKKEQEAYEQHLQDKY